MTSLPDDMNWKAFADYIASKYDWFGLTINELYKYEDDVGKDFRRIDHILSDKVIVKEKIILRLQKGDPFVDGMKVFTSTLNAEIRKKYDAFFTIEEVDNF